MNIPDHVVRQALAELTGTQFKLFVAFVYLKDRQENVKQLLGSLVDSAELADLRIAERYAIHVTNGSPPTLE